MFTTQQEAALRAIVGSQLPSVSGHAARERATAYLSSQIISSNVFPDIPFRDGKVWSARGARSQQRYLHGFLFFVDWYDTVLADESTALEAGSAALRIVNTWENLHSDRSTAPAMAYHDETTAQRLINLVSLEQVFLSSSANEAGVALQPLMSATADLLASDGFHAEGNNHGMFQDLAILYWSIMSANQQDLRRADYFEKSMVRLRAYFGLCFTSEGVHVENTPTYHLMVSRHVATIQKIAAISGHSDATYYSDLVRRAEHYATHALMPNGTYPPISDTKQTDIGRSPMRKVFTNAAFAFASTQGKSGSAPTERAVIFPRSGYAIYRSAWGDPLATFAFFSAAYNADYHKHSDDLSFFLRSSGIDLLSESGPYSYDYKEPFSKYAYSQFAHNSLIVDGTSLPRTDNRADKVTLQTVDERPGEFTVIGTNARYDDVTHQRTVDVTEKNGVPKFDLSDHVFSDTEHNYQLLWNLGTDVSVTVHGQGFELFHDGKKRMDLTFTANVATFISIQEGVSRPKPLGWRFPKFEEAVPSKVVVISFAAKNAVIDTKIRLADFSYTDRGLSKPNSEWSHRGGDIPLNYLFVPGKSAAGRKRLGVIFTAIHHPGDFTYNYKATLDEVDINALYILDDFGDQGAYYHSDHRSPKIFEAVQALIRKFILDLEIDHADVVTIGSSKGGTAALIHGFALPAGRVIAGAPQTRIGTFVAGPHPNILQFMAGGVSEDDIEHLDGIVGKYAAQANDATRVSILVGSNDHHLPRHVQPLVEAMSANKRTPPQVTVLADLSHSDIGSVFRFYLQANLEHWVSRSPEEALPYILTQDNEAGSIRIKVYSPDGVQLSYRLFKGSEIVRRRSYSDRQVVVFNDLPSGTYRVRVFRMDGDSGQTTAFTTRWISII
ncbi:heparinase II/III domain-containing protein [Arthrobacter sp. TMN-50]